MSASEELMADILENLPEKSGMNVHDFVAISQAVGRKSDENLPARMREELRAARKELVQPSARVDTTVHLQRGAITGAKPHVTLTPAGRHELTVHLGDVVLMADDPMRLADELVGFAHRIRQAHELAGTRHLDRVFPGGDAPTPATADGEGL